MAKSKHQDLIAAFVRIKRNMRRLMGAGVFMALSLSSPIAHADFIFDVSDPNAGISGYSGPYGTVDVRLVGASDATITFTSLDNGGDTYLFAGPGAVGLNINAASFRLAGFSSANSLPGFSAGRVSDGGARNEGGFGRFNQTLDSFGGFLRASNKMTVDITNFGGTWSSDQTVLVANSVGRLVAMRAFVCVDPCTGSRSNPTSGFAANGDPIAIPEPGGLTVIGTALIAMGMIGMVRRRRQISTLSFSFRG